MSCAYPNDELNGRTAYNLPEGWADSYARIANERSTSSGATATDEYMVAGLQAGTPVIFTVRARMTGSVDLTCFPGAHSVGDIQLELREGATLLGASGLRVYCEDGDAALDTTVVVQKQAIVGAAFTLTLVSRAGAADIASAYGRVTLSFADLPPGASVVSCQGFRQDGPVPVAQTSWGRLKIRHR